MEQESSDEALVKTPALERPCLPLVGAVFALLAMYIGVASLIGMALTAIRGDIGDGLAEQTLFFLPNVLAFFGVPWWFARQRKQSMRELYGLSALLPGDALRGVGWGILAQISGGVLIAYLGTYFPEIVDKLGDPAKDMTDGLSTIGWAVTLVQIVIFTPILEELFFRGYLLRALRCRISAHNAIAISATVFGLFHFQLIQTPLLILLGALLAWRAQKTNRLGESIFAHATFNLITALMLFASQ